jgi:hypothetical protein
MMMLLQLPAPVETRVIEPRNAPVSLVGLPCGTAAEKRVATQPIDADDTESPLQSKPFQCGLKCRVGIRMKKSAVVSVVVAAAVAHDRGRLAAAAGPRFTPSQEHSCSGEFVVEAVAPKTGWPVKAAFFYVSEVTFQDGTIWSADADTFTKIALAKWMLQPKRGQ